MSNVSAIVLAGGKATRLNGKDKGLVLYKNKPLISYVLKALNHQINDIVISANRHLDDYKQFGFSVISDGNKEYLGPLQGVMSALPLCKNNKVLVTTCDMPFLPQNILSLFDLTSNVDLQVISVNQRMQLCFLMDKALLTSLNEYILSGSNRVMQWLKFNHCKQIEYTGDKSHFSNFNQPSDFH